MTIASLPSSPSGARQRGSYRPALPDLTPEEHQRRGDAADALFREIQRRIAEKT